MRIPSVFDAHSHVRIGDIMEAVVPYVARYCQAAVVMPNTAKIRTGAQAPKHREEIVAIAARAGYSGFRPLMTVMLTDDTDPADVATWPDAGIIAGKYYPAELYPHGGVSDFDKIGDVLSEMGRVGIAFSGHIEKAGVHPLLAEQAAIPDFRRIADRGDIRVIFEHASTIEAIEAVREYPHAAATITPQHLWLTADDVYDASRENIRHEHNWCRPVTKTAEDREVLRVAAMSGDPKIFLGSDFAPHLAFSKANIPPPAGCACYPAALSVLAEVFAQYGRLDWLADFTSGHAARFYGIQLSCDASPLTITEEEWIVPGSIFVGSQDERIIPWLAGEILPFFTSVSL
ncbi:dihydroorotase [Candidatus Berkelbacteria bacterium CG11_big_fil_rev_8_21_14_0_20_42_15]|uniref:Dihydroorotase n=1 Tax=Candidatus Berkelbacteria bacterium CG11_big_fil_rev_8_21_14_0_20_42_15 TaxID=1974517 RepID=A0A2H0Q0B0_9BACT|nr:MAG: dihydroorotase [Candidatus Berkelbacteria bacterium CG11_big_fil_rev_8_21_14_0_20_42_15]